MERVLDVAQFIVDEYRRISGEQVTETKLHKLLYFSQRESLAVSGQPLFAESMEAWKYGPVSVDVRMRFGADGIEADTNEISLDAAYLLKNVILEYGQIAAWKLSELTHQELSWRNAREGLQPNESGHRVLGLEDIKKDAEKVRPYDHVWDMYYDEFDDLQEGVAGT